MRDVARDPAALELLRVQRSRLADRMRPPWWYLSGSAILWALVFAGPFSSRYLPRGVPTWPILVAALAVACLLQWGLARATGIRVGFRNLRYPASGRPARIAVLVVFIEFRLKLQPRLKSDHTRGAVAAKTNAKQSRWRRRSVGQGPESVLCGAIPLMVFGPFRTVHYYEKFSQVLLGPALGIGSDQSRANTLLARSLCGF